jgi:alkylation response protein AidB-like acyl-CoA dehydrogenase
MDFASDQEAADLARAASEFGAGVLNARLAERDRTGGFDPESWHNCARFGLLGLPMPRALGGTQQPMTTVVRTLEGLGHGCRDNGLLFGLGAQLWSVQTPILVFGTDEQKQRYIPRLVAGEIVGAHAVTEPEAGSDAHSLRTTAREDGAHYVLSGSKAFITNAPVADVFVIVATVDPAAGARGLTAFLVERDTPGLTVAPAYEKIGLRTSPMAEVALSDCRVPATAMLGRVGGGSAVFGSAMEWERAFILAPALGTMRRQIEDCIAYARTRRQFGRPIGKNPEVAGKIVEMQMRLDAVQLLMYRTAWLKDAGKRLTREPSQVKLQVSESWVQNSLAALQLHGAYGYMKESGMERDLTAALASKIYSGTSEMQTKIVASFLGL